MIPAIVTLAAIPFGSHIGDVKLVIADLNVGVLYIFAIASVSVYGIVLAGWSSNSKYPFLGGIRSSSQMISYELGLGLSAVPALMITGSTNLSTITQYQVDHGWLLFPFTDGHLTLSEILLWVPVIIAFVMFTICMFAETNRLPFDLPNPKPNSLPAIIPNTRR
jgi:NADH-quinone oxidoreductase subunit H